MGDFFSTILSLFLKNLVALQAPLLTAQKRRENAHGLRP
jgi:hypothetical protein